jgi:eukaryotic-like serine/threonine-protein kinase
VNADPFGLSGQVLDGQFRVDKLIGEGGFSVVYKGHHLGLDEPIALKCLKLPSSLGTALVESFVQRFRDESRLLYRLSQGNLHIVRSMASGMATASLTGALVPYMVLEWLEGRSVAQDFTVRRTLGQQGRELEEIVRLFGTAADALAYAHTQGVIHRDLNPGNLFFTTTSTGPKMKVLDFGVAKIMHDSTLAIGQRAQTLGAIRIFAPAYGAPEQFDDRVGPIGTWTDVYGFTLILLEALTDRTVNDAEHIGEFANLARDTSKRPTPRALGVAVSDAVEAVFAKALSVDPKQRWQNVGELWAALVEAVAKNASPVATSLAPTKDSGLFSTAVMDPSAHARAAGLAEARAAAAEVAPNTQRLGSALLQTFAMAERPPMPAAGRPPSSPALAPHPAAVTAPGPAPALAPPREPSFVGPPPAAPREPSFVGPPPATPREPFVRSSALPPSALPPSALPPSALPPAQGANGSLHDPRMSIESHVYAPHDASPPEVPKSRLPLIVAAVGGSVLALVVVVAVVILLRSPSKSPDETPPAASVPASVTAAPPPVAPPESATAPVEAPAAVEDASAPEALEDASSADAAAAAGPTPDPAPRPAGDPAPAPWTPPTPKSAEPPVDPDAFDEAAARAALRNANGVLAFCKRGGTSGPGYATVTFAPTGAVVSVVIAQPYAGTPEGACVEGQFKRVTTKKFVGAPKALTHSFSVPK